MRQDKLSAETDMASMTLLEISRVFGRVPNLFQAYAKHPLLLDYIVPFCVAAYGGAQTLQKQLSAAAIEEKHDRQID